MKNENIIENKQVLKKRIERCVLRLKKIISSVATAKTSSTSYYLTNRLERINSEIDEVIYLVLSYNQQKDLPNVESCDIENIEEKSLGQIRSYLVNLLRGLETANDYLEGNLKPNLSEKEQSEIISLRKELGELKVKECDLLILQNLEEALNEGESSHHLACGIISARIIDHIIHFIKEKENFPDENLNEKIVEELRELNVIEKDEIAGQDKKEFLDAAKSSRDAVSHKIEFLPNGSKAFSLLSYAFIMADLLIKYLEKKNGP